MCSRSGRDEDHSFCIVMRRELLFDCCLILPVPTCFHRRRDYKGGKVILETGSGVEWGIEFEHVPKNMIQLGARGWHAFCAHNQLLPGDSLVFTLTTGLRFSVLMFGSDGVEKDPAPSIREWLADAQLKIGGE